MDDQLLEKLVRLQEEQNDLLRKNLWRVKFSLFALMLLMTLSAIGLGIGVYLTRPKATPVIPLVTAPASPRTSSGMGRTSSGKGPGMGMGEGGSDCVEFQVGGASLQVNCFLSMALRMRSSLRMQATIAVILALPR
jgi:hypothetical protein